MKYTNQHSCVHCYSYIRLVGTIRRVSDLLSKCHVVLAQTGSYSLCISIYYNTITSLVQYAINDLSHLSSDIACFVSTYYYPAILSIQYRKYNIHAITPITHTMLYISHTMLYISHTMLYISHTMLFI